jgi:alkanesulfonate monooxygenase SsuD/methylene tetrahydromethanopterin reductase-like flavin-dependent oxidoreductase (luciferase family)
VMVQMSVAAHTKHIRLGQAANIIVWHHPVRLAEQIATLDVISGGRAEYGIGRGYQPRENETLGGSYGSTIQDQERNRKAFEETIAVMKKCWTEPSFSLMAPLVRGRVRSSHPCIFAMRTP